MWSAVAPAAPQPTPTPSPSVAENGAESPKRLVLDIDKRVERILAAHGEDRPHFETSVEVWGKPPQVMLERFFGGTDLECGPTPGGAPTEAETREYRHHPEPYLDFAALIGALAKKIDSKRSKADPASYFLYRVHAGNRVTYSLREDKIPDAWLFDLPGTTFELLATFSDPGQATAALRRAERGYAQIDPKAAPSPLPPWATANCRPRRR